jgi:hypothetical protein
MKEKMADKYSNFSLFTIVAMVTEDRREHERNPTTQAALRDTLIYSAPPGEMDLVFSVHN